MTTLKPCPCGEVPTLLHISIEPPPDCFGMAWGLDCCGEWKVRYSFQSSDSVATIENRATKAWNAAPRGEGA
jgi:hypothetical protein